jgi:hypothetical protein
MIYVFLLAVACLGTADAAELEDPVGKAVRDYFKTMFDRLEKVAEKEPTVNTFRKCMKPVAEETDGFFGGTLIDTDYVIRQVYFRKNFLARGFDLNKVDQLTDFWAMMDKDPKPQLSEPGRGNLLQPRLIAMRYPVIDDGKLTAVVSVMVRTEAFLSATGLDKYAGYRITCRGVVAEEEGDLDGPLKSVSLKLPSTDWVIEYNANRKES